MRKENKYEVGSEAPEGYIAWHSWAAEQVKGGLKQTRCSICSLLWFPQELSPDKFLLQNKPTSTDLSECHRICLDCVERIKNFANDSLFISARCHPFPRRLALPPAGKNKPQRRKDKKHE